MHRPLPAARRDRLASPAWGANAEGIAGIAPALVEHHEVAGADHAYNPAGGDRELTERVYDLIAGHVRRAVGEADAR